MKNANKAILAAVAAAAGAGAAVSTPQLLEAQVIRCYKLECIQDGGKYRCVETPIVCPPL